MTETTLWTNSAPTASFANQNITLSDNISNYDYIAIEVRFSASYDNRTTYIYKSSELTNLTTGAQYPMPYLGLDYSGYYYYRVVRYISSSQLEIGTCKRNTSSGAPSNANTSVLPLSVKGLKYA